MTQKQIILKYLTALNDWEYEYKIRAINTSFGWIGARGDRDVRDLIESGALEKKMEGKYCKVRIKPPEEKPKVEPIQLGLGISTNRPVYDRRWTQ